MIRYQRKCRTTASRCRASKTITGLELFLLPPNKLVTFCPLKEYKSISIELDNMHHKQVKSRMLARTLWRKRFARSSKCVREREEERELCRHLENGDLTAVPGRAAELLLLYPLSSSRCVAFSSHSHFLTPLLAYE